MNPTTTQIVQDFVAELGQTNHIHEWDAEEVIKFVAHKMKYFDDNFKDKPEEYVCLGCSVKETE